MPEFEPIIGRYLSITLDGETNRVFVDGRSTITLYLQTGEQV